MWRITTSNHNKTKWGNNDNYYLQDYIIILKGSNDEEEPDINSTTCIKETPPTLHPINPPHVKDNTRDIDYVREVLFKQMRTAAHQLELSQSVEHSSHLCRLIRDYADTVKTLEDI